jgi:hypothetical protein
MCRIVPTPLAREPIISFLGNHRKGSGHERSATRCRSVDIFSSADGQAVSRLREADWSQDLERKLRLRFGSGDKNFDRARSVASFWFCKGEEGVSWFFGQEAPYRRPHAVVHCGRPTNFDLFSSFGDSKCA